MRDRITNHDNYSGSAIIVGGSLSGLMTGIALAREGIQVTILEKSGEERDGGGGLQVEGAAFEQNKTAKYLKKLISNGKKNVQLWSNLEKNLKEAAQSYSNVELKFNTRVQTIDQDKDIAKAVTEKGEIFSGDILVGADGHRSLVRKMVSPENPDARFAGYIVWIASVDERELPVAIRPEEHAPRVQMLNTANGFLFGSVMHEENEAQQINRRVGCTWYDNSHNDLLRELGCIKDDVVHHSLRGEDIPGENLKKLAEAASQRMAEPWATVMHKAIQARSLTGIPIKEYVPEKLINGRIALVGDAAHVPAPITASGFNESLQDAAILATCASKGITGGKALHILQKYESLRLNKVRHVVQSGQFYSQSFGRA